MVVLKLLAVRSACEDESNAFYDTFHSKSVSRLVERKIGGVHKAVGEMESVGKEISADRRVCGCVME